MRYWNIVGAVLEHRRRGEALTNSQERTIEIQSSKLLSYLLLYPHEPVIRTICLAGPSVLGGPSSDEKRWQNRYKMKQLLGEEAPLKYGPILDWTCVLPVLSKLLGTEVKTVSQIHRVRDKLRDAYLDQHIANIRLVGGAYDLQMPEMAVDYLAMGRVKHRAANALVDLTLSHVEGSPEHVPLEIQCDGATTLKLVMNGQGVHVVIDRRAVWSYVKNSVGYQYDRVMKSVRGGGLFGDIFGSLHLSSIFENWGALGWLQGLLGKMALCLAVLVAAYVASFIHPLLAITILVVGGARVALSEDIDKEWEDYRRMQVQAEEKLSHVTRTTLGRYVEEWQGYLKLLVQEGSGAEPNEEQIPPNTWLSEWTLETIVIIIATSLAYKITLTLTASLRKPKHRELVVFFYHV